MQLALAKSRLSRESDPGKREASEAEVQQLRAAVMEMKSEPGAVPRSEDSGEAGGA